MIRGGRVVLPVADVGRSERFYIETLGMKLLEEGADGASIIDAGEGFALELRRGDAASRAGRAQVRFYPKIGIDEAIAIFENRGVVFSVVDRTEHAVVANFQDPDGNALCLVQRL